MRNLVLFDPYIGPYQVLPIRARVGLGAMAMKGYSAFSKAPALLKPQGTRWEVSYSSAEVQLVYSIGPDEKKVEAGEIARYLIQEDRLYYVPRWRGDGT